MNYITRTFNYTVATIATIVGAETDTPEVKVVGQITLNGEADKAKVLKTAKKLPNYSAYETIVVTKLDTLSELRGMTVSEFLEKSVIMDDPRTPHTVSV